MDKKKSVNSLRMPVYRDAAFDLFDAETASMAFVAEAEARHDPDLYIYSRYRNPTVVDAEKEIMKREGSGWALLTQTGMSAIDIAISIFQRGKKTRPWLFFSEIYGGTLSYIESVLKSRRGLDIHTFSPDSGKYDTGKLDELLRSLRPEFIYFETISNPMLIVPDALNIIRMSKKYGAITIVDNTFATPLLWKPLEAGADIVIHSATKYFSGHGNLTAGILCGNNEAILKSAIEYRKYTGHMISSDDAYRLNTQMQSLNLRVSRQLENAGKLSELLERSPAVCKTFYPGLKSHPTHTEASLLFGNKGFGAVITFDFAGENHADKRSKRDRFISSVSEKIRLVPSLGDSRTTLLPVESVWGEKYPEPGMIRLSVGFEDYDEIEHVISMALQ